jgi:hypothetical protein
VAAVGLETPPATALRLAGQGSLVTCIGGQGIAVTVEPLAA